MPVPPPGLLVPLALLPESVAFYAGLMIAGFVVGIYGHLLRSRLVITIGVGMIFIATLLLPVALNVFAPEPPPPDAPPYPE